MEQLTLSISRHQRLYPKEYDESSKGFLKNSADYWIFSNDENNWSLDSKRKNNYGKAFIIDVYTNILLL